jgi:hypothetical protein
MRERESLIYVSSIYAPLILSQLSIPTEGGRDGGDSFYSTIIRLKREVEDRMEDRVEDIMDDRVEERMEDRMEDRIVV